MSYIRIKHMYESYTALAGFLGQRCNLHDFVKGNLGKKFN